MCSLSCSRSPYTPPTNKLTLLPNHITPPSGLTKFIAKNPFEADLMSKLHNSVLSPTIFEISSSCKKGSPQFTWTIDDIAILQPAEIDKCPIQEMDCSDSEAEKNAQEAIIKFFNENQIIPSPLDVKNNECDRLNEMQTPIRKQYGLNLPKEEIRQIKEKIDNKLGPDCLDLTSKTTNSRDRDTSVKLHLNFTQERENCGRQNHNFNKSTFKRKLFIKNFKRKINGTKLPKNNNVI